MYVAIVNTNEDGRVAKHKDFATQAEAEDHVAVYGGFVAEHPGGDAADWLVDGETVVNIGPTETDLLVRADRRYEEAAEGPIMVNGVQVRMSAKGMAKLLGGKERAKDDPSATFNVKAADGSWHRAVSAAQMTALANAAIDHQQAAFDAHMAVSDDIKAGTITTIGEIETDTRWPGS